MISGVVWAMCALGLVMIIVAVYFAIFFMLFGVIWWGIAEFLKPVFRALRLQKRSKSIS